MQNHCRHKRQPYSIKRVAKIVVWILIPALLIDFAISLVAVAMMRRQTSQYVESTTSLYSEQLNNNLNSIRRMMEWTILQNKDMTVLKKLEKDNEFYSSYTRIASLFSEYQRNYGSMFQFFVFLENKDDEAFINTSQTTMPYYDYLEMKKNIVDKLKSKSPAPDFKSKWTVLPVNDSNYVTNVVAYGNSAVVCVASAEALIAPLRRVADANKAGDGSVAVLIDDANHPITSVSEQVSPSGGLRRLFGAISFTKAFDNSTFTAKITVNDFGKFETIIIAQFLTVLLSILIAGFSCILMIFMERRVLKPIELFLDNLKNFDEKSELIDFKDNRIIELEQTNQQFKNLIKQIKKLKIDVYENEINQQQTQLDYMQLQIKPHFFLNCLTSIYSMAQTQMYEEIEKMTISTSKYFRYIFSTNQSYVRLELEIEHVRDYLNIQKMRYDTGFSYSILQDKETNGLKIPPLVLQTFIENSIKHTVSLDEEIKICVSCRYVSQPEGDIVNIQITDTGVGFAPEILKMLQANEPLSQKAGTHIGISNTIKRFDLLYNGMAKIQFANMPTGGAQVTIIFPAEQFIEEAEKGA